MDKNTIELFENSVNALVAEGDERVNTVLKNGGMLKNTDFDMEVSYALGCGCEMCEAIRYLLKEKGYEIPSYYDDDDEDVEDDFYDAEDTDEYYGDEDEEGE